MIGAVRGSDPQTGHHFDDTRRCVDALDLSPGARDKVHELSARCGRGRSPAMTVTGENPVPRGTGGTGRGPSRDLLDEPYTALFWVMSKPPLTGSPGWPFAFTGVKLMLSVP